MLDREAVDDKEFMRLIYKMFAELWDDKKTPTIKRKPLIKPMNDQPAIPADSKTDPADTKDESE
jgi:hypothetical protein